MIMCKSLTGERDYTLTLLPLIILFLIVGCSHVPGHPPTNGGTTAACDNNIPAGATWIFSEPERAGAIWVGWFRSPMSTPQNPVIHMDVVADAPLFLLGTSDENPGHVTGGSKLMSNREFISTEDNGIKFSCGCDSVTGASIISGGTQTDKTFDGTSSIERASFATFKLYNLQTWIVVNCQRGFEDHNDKPVNFPISVLTQCRRPDGSEYEVETTLVYKTFSNCSHAQL